MKNLLILLLIGSLKLSAQHMNDCGHFVAPAVAGISYQGISSNSVKIGQLILQGNSLLETSDSYITLSGNYESTPSFLRVYSKAGNLLFEKRFANTINFILSSNERFAAFYDLHNTCVIDLQSYSLTTYPASTVFAINNIGELAYYDEHLQQIQVGNTSIPIAEPIYQLIYYKQFLTARTLKGLFVYAESKFKEVFLVGSGRLFEVQCTSSDLLLSTKEEKGDGFLFTSYHSQDLHTFIKDEEKLCQRYRKKVSSAAQKENIDLIQNPLYFDEAEVYQPIGNSYAEIQEYQSGDIYTHPGVDLLGFNQQEVRSVRKGYVKAILTTSAQYHWRIAIADANTNQTSSGYLYAHLDDITIPFTVGDSVEEGDVLGKLVDFPVEGFVHCHFAKIMDKGNTWNGLWRTYQNPMSLIVSFRDTTAPVFEQTLLGKKFAFRDPNGNYLKADQLKGNVRVISKVYDLMNSEWKVDVHQIGYNISPVAEPQNIVYSSNAFTYDYFLDFYGGGSDHKAILATIYSRDNTCFSTGNYDERAFYHVVSSSDGNDTITGNDSLQFFKTTNFQDGMYILRVLATDASGNSSCDSMLIGLQNGNVGIEEQKNAFLLQAFPNPSADGLFLIQSPMSGPFEVFDFVGKRIQSGVLDNSTIQIDLSSYEKGIYLLRFENRSLRLVKL